jgi:hypothetical protein
LEPRIEHKRTAAPIGPRTARAGPRRSERTSSIKENAGAAAGALILAKRTQQKETLPCAPEHA